MAQGVKKINEWIMKDGRTLIVTVDIDANKLSPGTLSIDPNAGTFKYVKVNSTGKKTWEKFSATNIFETNSINSNLIANNSITSEKLADRSITSIKIKQGNVTNVEIGDQQVYEKNIKDQNVTRNKIKDKCIDSTKIQDYSIQAINIANGSINADKLLPRIIQENHIVLNSLTKNVIANKTLTNAQIADSTITESLIATNAISTGKIKDSAITENKISIDCIKENHIKNNVISSSKIKDGAVTSAKILELDGSKIINNTINESKMKDNSVSSRTIVNSSISYEKLSSSVKDYIDRSIKLENSISVDNINYKNAALIKGSLILKSATSDPSNLIVNGNISSTGSLSANGNISSKGTITATKVFNPVYADLAEAYVPTEKLEPGDAVSLSLDGNLKIEKLNKDNTDRFLGFVSDEYATVFGATNEELIANKKIAITLIGRIKIKLNEDAIIGDYIYISNGQVKTCKKRTVDTIGRVLENKKIDNKYVLCQLWP